MRCGHAFDINLADFTADKASDRWAAFREHCADCSDCASEVAIWTEVESMLRAGVLEADPVHPSKELLLAYEAQPHTLSTADMTMLEGHLATCCSCPDELAALRSFDFSVLRRQASSRSRRSWRGAALRFAESVRAVALHPAFAYALVMLLLYPALIRPHVVAQGARKSDLSAGMAPMPVGSVAIDTGRPSPREVEAATAVSAPGEPAQPRAVATAKTPMRVERAKLPPRKPVEHAIARAPAQGEAAPAARQDAERHDDEADLDDREDPESDAPHVLGLADLEEPPADAEGRSSKDDLAAWRPVVLAPGQTPAVDRSTVTSGIALRLPESVGDEDIRVRGPDGRDVREETRRPASGGIEIRIRNRDLVVGTYRVDTRAGDPLAFEVR